MENNENKIEILKPITPPTGQLLRELIAALRPLADAYVAAIQFQKTTTAGYGYSDRPDSSRLLDELTKINEQINQLAFIERNFLQNGPVVISNQAAS